MMEYAFSYDQVLLICFAVADGANKAAVDFGHTVMLPLQLSYHLLDARSVTNTVTTLKC